MKMWIGKHGFVHAVLEKDIFEDLMFHKELEMELLLNIKEYEKA